MHDSTVPWGASLTQPEHMIVLYFLVVAGFALLAGTIRSWATRNEVGSRYRPAVIARLAIASVATIAYLVLAIEFVRGYTLNHGVYVPNAEAIMSFAPRYMEWSVTVPILTIELLAVCTLAGATSRAVQSLALGGSFLMILAGFIGAFVIDGGGNVTAMLIWGAISAVFWVFTNLVLIWAVRQSYRYVTPESASVLRSATILLLSGWVVYPIVYVIQIFGDGGAWATAIQIALCVADVVVKIGFGGLIHRVAKLRTAEDVRAGDDVHPESIWSSSIKLSDAGRPHEVYLADEAIVHPSRRRPPSGIAIPADPPEGLDE